MLKRLELIGFKSFAEKTRFDFAAGITAIVGPNGSGKSNIVDAVKWILGEQSSKSLRAGEMADVIFNGSSSRKSLGMAEVTMTFDNSKRVLAFDADEVQITRRVYRDGQGEYLINNTESRLKDIKDVFLGSGAGQGAYSIIEQGRVDALLVASTKDRRTIFEEAAGISRFRADKVTALRKLEQTNTHLNRVKDLLLELEQNLRKLSTQAAKAQKYQEYHTRLKELRIAVGLHDYRELQDTLAYEEGVLATLRQAVESTTANTSAGEAALRKLDSEWQRVEVALRQQQSQLATAREQIAELEANVSAGREQASNADAELLRIGQQKATLSQRRHILETDLAAVHASIAESRTAVETEHQRNTLAEAALKVVVETIRSLTKQTEHDRKDLFDTGVRAAQQQSAAERYRNEVLRLQNELNRKKASVERTTREANALAQALSELTKSNDDIQLRLATRTTKLAELQQQQAELRSRAEAFEPELTDLRANRNAAAGRLDVLQGLEQSLEGIGAGVRAVMSRLPHPAIVGFVADLLRVPSESAPLIDIALGEIAQRFVVRDFESLTTLLDKLPGRVGFLPLAATLSHSLPLALPEAATAATSLVQSDYPQLVQQLLGQTWIVPHLLIARQLQREFPHIRFVTRLGELLEPDGTLVVGPPQSETSIVSRKSELRDLHDLIAKLDERIRDISDQQQQLRHTAEQLDDPISSCTTEIAALTGEAGSLREGIAKQTERHETLLGLVELATIESEGLTRQLHESEQGLAKATELARLEAANEAAIKARLADADEQVRLAESTRETRQHEHVAVQLALNSATKQLDALMNQAKQLKAEYDDQTRAWERLAKTELDAQKRQLNVQLSTLRATMLAADNYNAKEAAELNVASWNAVRQRLREDRERVLEELEFHRDAWKQQQDQAHAHELTVRDLQNRRDGIVTRIREDYQVELASIVTAPHTSADDQTVEAMQDEIDELKRKITKLGSVNLEALEQLVAEEAREKKLRDEFNDLTQAEKSLLEIIEKINTDSRTLLNETIATVRVQFQELFRKLFGGGMAEIVFEDPNDILESGIEITARPPGKELRSISLMSGGEKTLTAIALLLAIFRSKPSPFCLLDEVDAALDEANTARLADVIREFRDRSQFIIVTHKKRTMSMADVLHGVTMQESGVSKQVATRIDDWPDEQSQQAA